MNKSNVASWFFVFTTIVLAVLLILNRSKKEDKPSYDSSTVFSKISHIQELSTVKYNYTGVIGYKDAMKIFNMNIPLTEKFFLVKYNGYLKAGVDFDRIVVDVVEDRVHVSVPRARIFDIVIDENSITVYNESDNAFNPIKISDYNQALAKEKDTMRKDAIKQGILRDANQHAELAIKSLLKEMGFEDVDITVEVVIPEIH